ncbi:MAG: hypothetical protein A3F72_05035 [Bacteroidetes bacterium RIFCSPLOWO2_12_FULL_35_15]|nr:MAG: hypothetical protein A3F72_05035 [Bacteroidetes bacterium RIFCSPLOWO2_12_FULL_35_15]
MSGRNFTSENGYRYGFNGQEKDDEIMGKGNSLEFLYRIYDPRLGRFLSLDPMAKEFPWNSPYSFAENRVIDANELEGREFNLVNSVDNQVQKQVAQIKKVGLNDATSTVQIQAGAGMSVLYTIEGTANLTTSAGQLQFGRTVVNNYVNYTKTPEGRVANLINPVSTFFYTTFFKSDVDNLSTAIENKDYYNGSKAATNIAITSASMVTMFKGLLKGSPVEVAKVSNNVASEFMSSATQEWGNGLTEAGRALQKHAGRAGSSFADEKFYQKTGNDAAIKLINDITNSSDKMTRAAPRGGLEVYDTKTGKGYAISREGKFNGFRDLKEIKKDEKH